MILPWGPIDQVFRRLDPGDELSLLGCLSFERRGTVVPLLTSVLGAGFRVRRMITIAPHETAQPDFRSEVADAVAENRELLNGQGVAFEEDHGRLLASEDELVPLIDAFQSGAQGTTAVLDITSFPKRYFCFFVQQLMLRSAFDNVIITYTEAGYAGYPRDRLAHDPLGPDYLPGFPFPIPDGGRGLVVSVGFESLGLRAVVDLNGGDRSPRLLIAMSSDADVIQRQWSTVRRVFGEKTDGLTGRIEVVAPWDVEAAFEVLQYWSEDVDDGLTLAPFGVKPHTLAMALFGIKNRCCLTYTQPRSYNPNYTRNYGTTWAYVIKWDGIACYDRPQASI